MYSFGKQREKIWVEGHFKHMHLIFPVRMPNAAASVCAWCFWLISHAQQAQWNHREASTSCFVGSQNRWLLSDFLSALADFLATRTEGRVTVLKCKLLKFLYAPWFLLSHHGELQVLLFTVISFKLNISRYWQDFFSKTIWFVGHESAKRQRDSIQSLRMVLLSLNGTIIKYESWQTTLPSLLRFFRYFFRCFRLFRLYVSSIVTILH